MHILLVEDHRDSREVLSGLLIHFGYDVATAGSVQEALLLLSNLRFDILLSDIGLPDGTGLELVAQAKKLQPWKKTVALTALGQCEDRDRGLGAGFDEYLTKPFDFHRLRSLLAEAG